MSRHRKWQKKLEVRLAGLTIEERASLQRVAVSNLGFASVEEYLFWAHDQGLMVKLHSPQASLEAQLKGGS